MPRQYSDFTETERRILSLVQKNLPDSASPFADIAASAGVSEEEVLDLLRSLLRDGSIRRFGASLKHQRAGFRHNLMVAWKVADQEEADLAARAAMENPRISHCYYRPSPAEDWPYEFFTMIHGRKKEDCLATIDFLLEHTSLREYAALESLKELKKTSMTYF
ncbi:MAG: Lrp/AsnC family transcriptional regulator [Deltaproteobacteria bacterium]|jgi:DNA-binding Lrp family transcriptional regulator|nr:Lrp/AsnC family transcriptional regulator [Deltaproteobacteria bacterium]